MRMCPHPSSLGHFRILNRRLHFREVLVHLLRILQLLTFSGEVEARVPSMSGVLAHVYIPILREVWERGVLGLELDVLRWKGHAGALDV